MARLVAAKEIRPRSRRRGPEASSAADARWRTRSVAATPTLSTPLPAKAFRQGRSSVPPTGRLLVARATRETGLIAASTAVTALPATAAVASASAAAPVLPGLGLVDGQAAAPHLLAAESRDGGLGLRVAAHLHEAEPLGAAGVPVHDDLGRLHRAVLREHLLQHAVGGVIGEVPDVQLLAHLGLREK